MNHKKSRWYGDGVKEKIAPAQIEFLTCTATGILTQHADQIKA